MRRRWHYKLWATRLTGLVMLVVLLVGTGLAIYHSFVRWQGNRFDLYPRWVGVQAMFTEGLSPYSEEVALRSQEGIYGRPARLKEGESQHHFLYPAFIAFTIPHLWLPFPVAITAWIVTELMMLALIAKMLAPCMKRRLRLWAMVLIAVALSVSRYNALSLGLGQFTIYILFFLVLAWWLWERQHDFQAGLAMTQAVIKPQLVFLVVPLWLGLALLLRRRRFLAGFGIGLIILILLPIPFIGNWLPDFLHPPAQYERVAGTSFLSNKVAQTLQVVLSALGWPLAAWVWLRTAGIRIRRGAVEQDEPPAFPTLGYALALTVAIILVTTPRIRGYDLSMATLPLCFLILAQYQRRPAAIAFQAGAWIALLVLPWVLSIQLPLQQLESVEQLVFRPAILGLILVFPAVRRRPTRLKVEVQMTRETDEKGDWP
jgi:hypothetical protein